jgi:RNA polymerase sigma factor (sigma-70 family)
LFERNGRLAAGEVRGCGAFCFPAGIENFTDSPARDRRVWVSFERPGIPRMEANLTPGLAPQADRDLLRAFVDRADGSAFAELVARHGPLVLGACRRVLADAPDAEDAFQATFFILARKAKTVRRPERLGSWLYGVALRCAFRVRKRVLRAKEQPMPELPAPAPADPHWADVRRILDSEIGKLPEKLRTALVLCELQGLDRATVAARLGVPIGTVSSRLSRAKDALRQRLVRRGVTLTLVAVGLVLTQAAAVAAVPPPLAGTTVTGALGFATGASGSTRAAVLAGKILHEQFAHRVAVGLVAVGLIVAAFWGGWKLFQPVPDRERIQGNWEFVSFQFGGEKMPGDFRFRAAIDEEMVHFGGMPLRYTLDPSQSPKAIDMEVPGANGEPALCQGVYELTDDRLTIHLAMAGLPRPTSLQPADEGQAIVMVMERVKEE